MSESRLRLALFSTVRLNPYVGLLAAGVHQADTGVEPEQIGRLSLRWGLRESSRYAIMHLHWAELQYASSSPGGRFRRLLSFLGGLWIARRRGLGLVYTVHNIAQHEGRQQRLNRWVHQRLFAWADALHVHDQQVADAVIAQAGPSAREKLWVIPHGSYVGCYPNTHTRAEARVALGLDDGAFVYLALGGLRPYKGVEELIAAFRRLPDVDARLVIVGHPHEPAYAEAVRRLAAGDARIQAILEYVPDDALQTYMHAADLCLFPYRQATTSGAAILALSFGRPIVAPALGPFPELVQASAGVLYDPAEPNGLLEALREGRQMDQAAAADAVQRYLEQVSWKQVGGQFAALYRQVARRREGRA